MTLDMVQVLTSNAVMASEADTKKIREQVQFSISPELAKALDEVFGDHPNWTYQKKWWFYVAAVLCLLEKGGVDVTARVKAVTAADILKTPPLPKLIDEAMKKYRAGRLDETIGHPQPQATERDSSPPPEKERKPGRRGQATTK